VNITATIKTKRNGDANRPFGEAHMGKKPTKFTDPNALVICSDPLPEGRASSGCKYQSLFEKMTMGQCVKCSTNEVGRVSGALKKWASMQVQGGSVRSMKNYGDGMGRVWWLPAKAETSKSKSISH
jgi:hypothetical protein